MSEERSAGGNNHHSWTTGYVETRRKNQYLLRQKYILLTYSQVNEDEFHWENIVAIVFKHGGKCRIGRELHKDGGVHYHAFCVKDKRFITRSPQAFDVDGHHPNIEPIKRTPHRAWAYVSKDGEVVHDDIPEPPAGRSKLRNKQDEVYHLALQRSHTAGQFINTIIEGDTRRAVGAFGNIYSFANWRYPPTRGPRFAPPEGFEFELSGYPDIANWKQRNVPEHSSGKDDADSNETRTSSEGDSVHSGEDIRLGSEVASTAPTSIDSFVEPDSELSRYAEQPKPAATSLNIQQHRPKSLCLIGGSKLGKSVVARSFGHHNYFHGQWSLDEYDDDAVYNIFDDIPGQLNSFDYKKFLGAQFDCIVSDKYKKKRKIRNGKPCIYISNNDPLKTKKGKEDRDWLLANCIFVYIDKPICNYARINLEREAHEQEDADLEHVLNEALAQME